MSGASGRLASPRVLALCLALTFFALQIPELFDISRYHGDERFYTDAAIGMLKSGDYLMPRYPDGGLRVEKPLLSYLVLSGSYALFGVSLFSTRLPFLLAGAVLVWVTWRAGSQLLRNDAAALLAAAMVASSSDFLALSGRATPDIFLCVFVMAGLTGFARLLRGDADSNGAAASAWLGAGLAMAVKGGLGAVVVGYALVAAAARRERVAALRRLLHPWYTPAGLAIAAAGFGVYALHHGTATLRGSVGDQVDRSVHSAAEYGRHFFSYLAIVLEHFAPWFALIAIGSLRAPRALIAFVQREAFLARFLLGWLFLLLVIFAGGDLVRGRFLAPAYPALALLLAAVLVELWEHERARSLLKQICFALLWLGVAGGVALALGGARIGPELLLAGLGMAGVAAGGLFVSRRSAVITPLLAVAFTLLVVQSLADASARATFSRSPVPALAARLLAPDLAGARVLQIGESAHLASKLRVATGGRREIDGRQRDAGEPDWGAYDVIVSDAPLPEAVAALGFRIERCGESWGDDWTASEILEVLRAPEPAAILARRSQPHFVAIREPAPSH